MALGREEERGAGKHVVEGLRFFTLCILVFGVRSGVLEWGDVKRFRRGLVCVE